MVVSYEIAKKLADMDFPQPEPEFGQIWYLDYDNGQNTLGRRVLVGTAEFHTVEQYDMVFAPSISDLLPLTKSNVLCDEINSKYYVYIGQDRVYNDNIAELLALYYIQIYDWQILPYKVSKNYQRLYEILCKGLRIVCYVGYKYSDEGKILRDIARCIRREAYDIQVGVRGIEYGGVRTFEKDKGTEIDLFIQECERMDLQWIEINL